MSEDRDNTQKTEGLEVQPASDGVGPRYHRVYSVDLPDSYESVFPTMRNLMLDPNAFSPQLIATFEKTKGLPDELNVDDEFMVHLSAPWKGPVRVSQVGETTFTLVTLDGHIEAGQIQFSLLRKPEGGVRFEIESVTRSKDRIVDFFYDKLRLAQFAQSEMWEEFCRNFAAKANGTNEVPLVQVRTEKQNRETGLWQDVSDQFGAHGFLS